MRPSRFTIDPNHETKRAVLSRAGLGMLLVGVPVALIGVGLFVSVFFTGLEAQPFGRPPIRPVIGLLMAAGGGFLSIMGLQALIAGNVGRILRYKLGEALPVAEDAGRQFAPTANDLARGLAGAIGDGFREGAGPTPVQHACGAWNEPDARFCKLCGASLSAPSCSKCGARLESDAMFCPQCGVERPLLA